jgi:hypothetical protein
MTGPRRRRGNAPVVLREVIEPSKSGLSPAGSGGEQSPPAKRRRRASVGGFVSKLDVPQATLEKLRAEGKTPRFVNDDVNRLEEVKELGYEFVSDKGVQTSQPGSRISRLVGTKANGEPLHAYLMETPDELFAQGLAEQEAANRLIDESITAGRDSTGRMDEHQYGHGSIKVER